MTMKKEERIRRGRISNTHKNLNNSHNHVTELVHWENYNKESLYSQYFQFDWKHFAVNSILMQIFVTLCQDKYILNPFIRKPSGFW